MSWPATIWQEDEHCRMVNKSRTCQKSWQNNTAQNKCCLQVRTCKKVLTKSIWRHEWFQIRTCKKSCNQCQGIKKKLKRIFDQIKLFQFSYYLYNKKLQVSHWHVKRILVKMEEHVQIISTGKRIRVHVNMVFQEKIVK